MISDELRLSKRAERQAKANERRNMVGVTPQIKYPVRVLHGIVPRWEAQRKGLPTFFTGLPCPREHISHRDTKTGECLDCAAERREEARRREATGNRFPAHNVEHWEFRGMLMAQGMACAICGDHISEEKNARGQRTAHVDHCHATGRVRGLLCRGCNHGLGNFKDRPEALESAAAYLRGLDGTT